MILPRDKKLNCYSRNLRNNATKQENHLWYDYLKLQNQQFFRQRIIGDYIVDFYCPTVKLAIELDGNQHHENEAIEYDTIRTEYLNCLGIKVLRFNNIDIDNNFNKVCDIIKQAIHNHFVTAALPK